MSDPVSAETGDQRVLVLDASTAINFIDVNAWQMLLRIPGFALVTPKIVARQVEVKDRRKKPIRDAVSSGSLRVIDEELPPQLLAVFVDTAGRLGEQDAAVLVYAVAFGGGVAADDRALRNEAHRRGVQPILGTEELLAAAVTQGYISLAQGNRRLGALRNYRFDSRLPCLCLLCGTDCACGRI